MTLGQKRLEADTWNGRSLFAAQLLVQIPSDKAPRRLCDVGGKGRLQQGDLESWSGSYLPNQDDLSDLGP